MQHEYQFSTKFAMCTWCLKSIEIADLVFTTAGILATSCGWVLHTTLANSHMISSHHTPAAIMSHVQGMVVYYVWYLNNIYVQTFCRYSSTVSDKKFQTFSLDTDVLCGNYVFFPITVHRFGSYGALQMLCIQGGLFCCIF